jgi:hypothetical protein
MLDARMLGWKAGLCKSFAVKKSSVAEAFRNLVDILKILAGHLI